MSDVGAPDGARSERAWRELARRAKAKALGPHHRSAFGDALLADAAGTDVAKADRASGEIARQVDDGEFPPGRHDAMIAYVLRGFDQSDGSDAWSIVVWRVHNLAITGRLTPQQVDRFFSHALAPDLRVRPRVIDGEDVPFTITGLDRFPFVFSPRVSRDDPVIRLDGGPVELREELNRSFLPTPALGRHELAAEVTFTVTRDDGGVRWRKTFTPSAPFDVVPDTPDNAVPRHADPALRDAIRRQVRTDSPISTRDSAKALRVMLQDPPVDVAFDVFVRAYGQETSLGSLALAKSDQRGPVSVDGVIERLGQPLTTVDVILRASPAAARRTTNITSIWDGEIELKDVVIRAGPPK